MISDNLLAGLCGDQESGQATQWYHLTSPSQEELDTIIHEYQMPAYFLTSGLDIYEVPWHQDYINPKGQLITHAIVLYPIKSKLDTEMDLYTVLPIALVSIDQTIFSVSMEPVDILRNLNHLASKDSKLQLSQFDYIMHFMYKVSRRYIELLTIIDQMIYAIEQKSRVSSKNEIFYQLIGINKTLIKFEKAIEGNEDVLKFYTDKVKSDDIHQTDELSVQLSLREHNQASLMIHESKAQNDKLFDMLSNVVNNNLNQIMRILTIVSIIIAIPSTIFSLWGTNVPVPFQEHPLGFYFVILITMVLVFLGIWWIKRSRLDD